MEQKTHTILFIFIELRRKFILARFGININSVKMAEKPAVFKMIYTKNLLLLYYISL